MEPSWDTTYLLGWYDHSGKAHLTTWDGPNSILNFVVTGITEFNIPMWDSSVPRNAKLHLIPEGKIAQDFAREIGGYCVIGWKVPLFARGKRDSGSSL
jgi:hypothetical protein